MENTESQAAFFEMRGMSIDVHSKKRISDTVVGVIVLFVLSPLLIIISALVFAASIRSVVLKQVQRS